jgi:hypothetical protein
MFQQVTFLENMKLRMVEHTNSGWFFIKIESIVDSTSICIKRALKRRVKYRKLREFNLQSTKISRVNMSHERKLCNMSQTRGDSLVAASLLWALTIFLCGYNLCSKYLLWNVVHYLESLFHFQNMHTGNVHIDQFSKIVSREVKPTWKRKWMLDEAI